jgi:hypothetical protein
MKAGVELEGFAFTCSGASEAVTPADLPTFCAERTAHQRDSEHGTIKYDAGVGQLELVSNPHHATENILADLRVLNSELPDDWSVHYQCQRPQSMRALPLTWNVLRDEQGNYRYGERYDAMRTALARERPYAYRRVLHMAEYASLHVTIECDPLSQVGTNVLNFWNLAGPSVAHFAAQQLRVDNSRHLRVWQQWARAERLPAYRWFETPRDMQQFFEGIPRLLKKQGSGSKHASCGWQPDLESRQVFGDQDDEGVTWWFARPKRSLRDEHSPGGIEIRVMPACAIEQVAYTVQLVRTITQRVIEIAGDQALPPPASCASHSGRDAVFAAVADQVPGACVPRTPSLDDWYDDVLFDGALKQRVQSKVS